MILVERKNLLHVNEGQMCVTASVNRLGFAAGIYEIPFLKFTVHSVRIS